MKFVNKRKNDVEIHDADTGRKYTVAAGDAFDISDDNSKLEILAQAALDAGLETSDKLPETVAKPTGDEAVSDEKKPGNEKA